MTRKTLTILVLAAGPAGAEPLFPEGTATLTFGGAYALDLEDGRDLPAIAAGVDYFVIDNLSLGAELSGLAVFQDEDAVAASLTARLRHHLVARERGSLFLSVGIGPFYAGEPTPDDGTRFNFASHAGLGTALRLGENRFFTVGLNYWHLSNGRLVGDANPAINGVQAHAGLTFAL